MGARETRFLCDRYRESYSKSLPIVAFRNASIDRVQNAQGAQSATWLEFRQSDVQADCFDAALVHDKTLFTGAVASIDPRIRIVEATETDPGGL